LWGLQILLLLETTSEIKSLEIPRDFFNFKWYLVL
jgi:hypothetical protein